jgi:hypothetical protein
MHDRRSERDELGRIFRSGKSCQMPAPRRVGKTWLMHRVEEDFGAAGWLTAFIDLEGMQTEQEFLRELCRKLEQAGSIGNAAMSHLKQRLKRLISGNWEGTLLDAVGRIDPKEFSEELVASLNAQGKETLIFVDEITLFVIARLEKDPQGTLAFLYHLRKLRQAYPFVRWFFTGSIGLDVVARRANLLGAFVDLEIFPLESFDRPAARSYIDEACRSGSLRRQFRLGPDAFDHLSDELGWLVPYYLDLIGNRIQPTGNTDGKPIATPQDIKQALDELLKPQYRQYFATWEEHIDKNFPETEAELLTAILGECCEQLQGEVPATLLARLQPSRPNLGPRLLLDMLTALDSAGFLTESDGRWRFRSGLLRRYWKKYHCA